MAGKTNLYLPVGADFDETYALVSGFVTTPEVRGYMDPETAVDEAVKAMAHGEASILTADIEHFSEVKLILLKALSVKILRSSKISAKLGDTLPKLSKEHNIMTAVPAGGEAYPSSDGLYSAVSFRQGNGSVMLAPLDAGRLREALEAGAAGGVNPPKSNKEKLRESLETIAGSGKKIAVADFGKASALMAVVKSSLPDDDGTFTVVTALTDTQYGAKDFEASLAKSAKETAECDYGVAVSEISDEGVTISVADSDIARVEKIHPVPGEDAKHLLAAAVIRLCEMMNEASSEGIKAPEKGLGKISKTGFVIIIACLVAAIIACMGLCVLLFAKGTKAEAATASASASASTTIQEVTASPYEEMGEVELDFGDEVTDTISSVEDSIVYSFTTYVGESNTTDGAVQNNTTAPGAFTTAAYSGVSLAALPTSVVESTTNAAGKTVKSTRPLSTVSPKTTTASAGQTTKKASADGKFIFTVYGWGHGVGMSQDGAIAMAKNGKSCNQILTHYYPNTTIRTDPNTPMYAEKPNEKGEGGMTVLEFLCKTVKQEIGDGSPYEALKAQAVAAYTYAMNHNNFGAGQTMDSDYNYKGTNVEKAVMAVLHISSADQQPHCDYVSWNGGYANTVYYSNCARTTTSSTSVWGGSSIPYLCGNISSPEEVMISTYEISAKEMKSLINEYANGYGVKMTLGANPATWLKIICHDGAYSNAIGYVGTISVGGYDMSGNTFRSKLMGGKLKSHCFTIQYVV